MSAELPQVTEITNDCFYNCSQLASLSLPAVVSIGNTAFRGTNQLSSIKLGPNLTTLGNNIFDANTNSGQMSIYFAGDVPGNITNAFAMSNGSSPYTFQNIYAVSQYSAAYTAALGTTYGPIIIWNGVF